MAKDVFAKERAAPQCVVVYRQGGSDRFRWGKTMAYHHKAALEALEEVKKQGYEAFIQTREGVEKNGLPETFDAKEHPNEFEVRDGWYYRK